VKLPAATFGRTYADYDAKAGLQIGDVDGDSLTYSLVGAPSWLSINSAGVISGTAPALGATGAPAAGDLLTFKVKAADAALSTEQTVTLNIYNNPQITSIARANKSGVDSSGNTNTTGDVAFAIDFNKTDVLNATADDFTVTFTSTTGSVVTLTHTTDFTLEQGANASQYTLKVLAAKVATFADGTLTVSAVGGNIADSATNAVSSTMPTGTSNQSYVIDHVNQAPTFANTTATATAINENSAINTVVFTAQATDPDLTAPNKTLMYELGGTDGGKFSIDETSGAVTLTSPNTYDYETQSSYSFTVTAVDGGAGYLRATQTVSLAVNNVNEAPAVTSTAIADVVAVTGTAYTVSSPLYLDGTSALISSYFTDPDATSNFNTLTYSLDTGAPAWLQIDQTTGKLYGTAPAAAAQDLAVTVKATDGLNTVNKSFKVIWCLCPHSRHTGTGQCLQPCQISAVDFTENNLVLAPGKSESRTTWVPRD
jgi:hypothetical protein